MLNHSKWKEHIDPNRIGAIGHSSGGYTAIALAGAVYNAEMMKAYCESEDRGSDCGLVSQGVQVDYSDSSSSHKDERINVVIAMAPAVGPAIEEQSLESISMPVLIMATKDDEVLPFNRHAEYYAQSIPGSTLKLLEGGGHFIYMECTIITRVADWFISNLDLCGSQFNIDRNTARNEAVAMISDFLNSNLMKIAHNKSMPPTANMSAD